MFHLEVGEFLALVFVYQRLWLLAREHSLLKIVGNLTYSPKEGLHSCGTVRLFTAFPYTHAEIRLPVSSDAYGVCLKNTIYSAYK